MNEESREALEVYYKEAATWNRDRLESLRKSQRIAWWVAGGAASIAVMEAAALMFLTPLKTVEPYTLMVDRTTGYVQALRPLDTARITPDAALTQSFLVQYVTARESFDIDALQPNYNKVALWSAERARSDYLNAMQASNPQSPLAVYPRTTVVETRVKSVSQIARNVALVRFDTLRHDGGGQVQPVGSWLAVIRYRYSGAPMKLEDRFVNPLGFQVVRYRRDAEALPSPQAAPERTAVAGGQPVAVIPGTMVRSAPNGGAGAPDLRAAAEAALRRSEERRTGAAAEPEI
jgi:type IV secretion system protein VirB8